MPISDEFNRKQANRERELFELNVLNQEVAEDGFLERELVRHLYEARTNARAWKVELDEQFRLGNDHKIEATESIYLKYLALEMQSLCGLASLRRIPNKITGVSTTGNPSGGGRGNGPRR